MDDQNRRLCEAHRKDGQPCRAAAVHGAKVCRMHGAAAGSPGREAADRIMLGELIGPALATLKDLLDDSTTPPAVRLHTAREVLTRTGYGAHDRPPDQQIMVWVEDMIAEERDAMTPEENAAFDEKWAGGLAG